MNQPINIEQVRAKNAMSDASAKAGKENGEGDALSGYPSLIINNGLIATVAYSIAKGNQHERIADAIAWHLANLPTENLIEGHPTNASGFRDAMCEGDAALLKRCSHEALEFLAYLKRFQRH